VKAFYSREKKVAERFEIDGSGERKQLRIAEAFGLHVQGEGKANYFSLTSLCKKATCRDIADTQLFFCRIRQLTRI
jgi:hypothetical protein